MAPNDDEPGAQQQRERQSSKQKSSSSGGGGGGSGGGSGSKSKDLSHVPCKFYKVGGCTAGSSCPFSHNLPEPGQKETCAWFIKGNCKFAHKCALAHVLPGQDMSMDRKNKKAAQQAAAGSSGDKKKSGGSGSKKEGGGGGGEGRGAEGRSGSGERREGGGRPKSNTLLAGGSTAPTRILNGVSAKPPMLTLKATISPSAPAPPLKDSDFASLDDMEGVHIQDKSATGENEEEGFRGAKDERDPGKDAEGRKDFGPIGSPPTRDGLSPRMTTVNGTTSINGASNAATAADLLSTSPFTGSRAFGTLSGLSVGLSKTTRRWGDTPESSLGTPGFGDLMASHQAQQALAAQQLKQQRSQEQEKGNRDQQQHQQVSTSAQFSSNIVDYDDYRLGTARSVGVDDHLGGLSSRRPRQARLGSSTLGGGDTVVDDGDLEDFIPGSLTDLLTPEERNERNRRMSRSNSGQPASAGFLGTGFAPGSLSHRSGLSIGGGDRAVGGLGAGEEGLPGSVGGVPGSLGHRYSRSVPAGGLLSDVKNIWSDGQGGLPASPRTTSFQHRVGTPSSSLLESRMAGHLSSSHHDSQFQIDADFVGSVGSPSASSLSHMISPSNASAAFLPGFHQHYAAKKQAQLQALQRERESLQRERESLQRERERDQQQALQRERDTPSGTTASALTAGLTKSGLSGGLSAGMPSSLGGSGLSRGLRDGSYLQQPPLSSSTSNSYLGTLSEDAAVTSGSPGSFAAQATLHTHLSANGTAHTYRTTPSPFDLRGRNIPGIDRTRTPSSTADTLLSPSARALQSHAPGQSLPQGLAAGLSRIHALPTSTLISPGTPSALSALSAGLPNATSGSGNNGNNSNAASGAPGTSPAPSSLGAFTSGPYGEQPGSLSGYTTHPLGTYGDARVGLGGFGEPRLGGIAEQRGLGGYGDRLGGYGASGYNTSGYGLGVSGYGAAGYGASGYGVSGYGNAGVPGLGGYGGGMGGGGYAEHLAPHQQQQWGIAAGGGGGGGGGGAFTPSSLRDPAPVANDTAIESDAEDGSSRGGDREGGPPGLGAPQASQVPVPTQASQSTSASVEKAGGQPSTPSKLSYSAAASKAAAVSVSASASGGVSTGPGGPGAPPGLGRGKPKPVVVVQPTVHEDDDLFSMDG